MKIPADIPAFLASCEKDCEGAFQRIDENEIYNTRKLLNAFREEKISYRHFAPTTGYGYDDIGRDALSRVFARALGAEDALVRPQIASGTHALALCLYGVLRPGDTLVAAAGKPYDTLGEVIGIAGEAGQGSLKEFGVNYRQAELTDAGRIDFDALGKLLDKSVRLVLLQRSRGYAWRGALEVSAIGEAAAFVHKNAPRALVMVDNCYGEFTERIEPTDVGADLMAGSLIKNPGGGLAPTGGYLAGTKEAVRLVSYRLTSPGIGSEVGSYEGGYRSFYQGLFLAPHTVAQALKSACLFARAFERLGADTHPAHDAPRSDIIQAIRFGAAEPLVQFIRSIQLSSPVDSDAVPESWDMPGYQDPVIMAAGSFVAGASIELSADAPIRPPYAAYLQGALSYAHGRVALEEALERLRAVPV